MALDIEIRNLKRASVVTIKGRVDSSNAPELESAFQTLMDNGTFRLVADLSELEYISSAGLRLLVSTLKACRRYNRGDLRLSNIPPRIAEVLDLAGMTPLFTIFDDTVGAVGSF
ncbi:MAG: STAS domain-containing protein [Chloroflexota bacterium]|nr:STAS domain-containing protein [Chloroflexota bacterium]